MADEVHHVGAERDAPDQAGGPRSPRPEQQPGTASVTTVIEAGMWDSLLADSDIFQVSAGEPIYAAGQAPPVVADMRRLALIARGDEALERQG
jgi:hypothetical protein